MIRLRSYIVVVRISTTIVVVACRHGGVLVVQIMLAVRIILVVRIIVVFISISTF